MWKLAMFDGDHDVDDDDDDYEDDYYINLVLISLNPSVMWKLAVFDDGDNDNDDDNDDETHDNYDVYLQLSEKNPALGIDCMCKGTNGSFCFFFILTLPYDWLSL